MSTSTLLIRLEGPIQSWGDAASRWDYRTTGPRPTKSGVIGLIANAMGRTYDDPIDDLAALRFAVRADRPGHVEVDIRTAGGSTFPLDALTRWHNPKLEPDANGRIQYGAPRASHKNNWTKPGRSGVFRTATYLADAAFLASVTGDSTLIDQAKQALQRPARLLHLGRRANPPSYSLYYRILHGDQHDTWGNTEPLLPSGVARPHFWTETTTGGDIVYEQPATGRGPAEGQNPTRITNRVTSPPANTPQIGLR